MRISPPSGRQRPWIWPARRGEPLRIQFTGGEPLLRWDTAAKVLDFGRASGRRFHAAIQTNGTLLTPRSAGS